MVESKTPANPLFLRDEELRQGIELMFYDYRDFTFESDQQLKRYQLGRAHHRVWLALSDLETEVKHDQPVDHRH